MHKVRARGEFIPFYGNTVVFDLTPHITMAYFRPETYSRYDLSCLKKALQPVELDVTLRFSDLHCQVFRDRNHYENI